MNRKITSELSNLLNYVSDGFVVLNTEWCYTYVNKKAGEFLGKEPSALIGKHIWTEFPEGVGLPFYNAYYKAVETQQTQYLKEYYPPFDKWFENRIYPSPEGLTIYFTDITERINIENLLTESERYLNNIIDHIGDPIFVKDDQSRLLTVNDAFCKMFHLSRPDILGKTLAEDVSPEEQEHFLKIDKQVLEDGIENISEESLTVRDNKTRLISTKKTRFIDNKGKKFLIGIIRDITDRKKAEIKLQESEKNLVEAQKIAKIGSFNLDLETNQIKSSTTFNKILGLEDDRKITADLWRSLIYEEDIDSNLKKYYQSLSTRAKFDMEFRILTEDKKDLKWIHGLGEFVFVNGKAVNFYGTAQDITERKKIEIKLSKSEYNLRQSQIVANIGSFSFNIVEGTWESSISMDNIFGIDESFEKTFDNWRKMLHPDDAEDLLNYFEKNILINHERFDREYRIIRKNDKQIVWVHGLGEIAFSKDGTPKKIIGTTQDITERKKAEIELKLAKEFSENLILNLNEGLSVVNFDGVQIDANPALCKILGFSKEELLGQTAPFNYWPPENYENIYKAFDKVLNGQYSQVQLNLMRKNGDRFPALITTSSLKNNNGIVIAHFATIQDISERVKAQKTLESVAKKSIHKKKVIMELTSLVGSDYDKSLKKITALSASVLNVARVSVWKFNKKKTNISCEKLYELKSGKFDQGAVIHRLDNQDYFDALLKYNIINVEDALNNKFTRSFAKNYLVPLGITSMLDVFILGNQGMYGVICFEHVGDKRKWSADDEEFATSIASIVSLMIESTERNQAEKKLVLSNKELTKANKELNTLRKQLEEENIYLRNELALVFNYEEMIYGSEKFSNVLSEVEKVAPTNATVLLLGESGTGKELLARAIHNISLRNKKPLIKVNCSAIPRELIESELFGHKKGSFTGAVSDKIGKFELAHGGTLFLDEIGELPLDMQPKILRFLQEGEIEVVGGQRPKKLDVRVVAATNRNLKEEIEKKRFRNDLYFRLNVFPIEIPPLRSRPDDIPLLVEHFVDKFNKLYEKNIKFIPDETMRKLIAYKWPGNIRELENLIERAIILAEDKTLLVPGFETSAQTDKQQPINCKDYSLSTMQRIHILNVLEQCKWKISGQNSAAEKLCLKPSTLRDKMAKLGINKPH